MVTISQGFLLIVIVLNFNDSLLNVLLVFGLITAWNRKIGEMFRSRTGDIGNKLEYVFVDFNAWEYCATDELWAGMIRALYAKVEKRLEYEVICGRKDMKTEWRVRRAIELLESQYGGKTNLRVFLFLSFLSILALSVILLLYILDFIELPKEMGESQQFVISIILAAISFVGSNSVFRAAEMDRGLSIYNESKSVKDQIGLMASVREELSHLFDFINVHFKQETGIQLRLVLFIEDLDRCLEGRNVKMLEAIQLLLNVPGAPVLIFLAIDSRIVVPSIEKYMNNSLISDEVMITGWEYLEKIVQIPFCLPELPEERVNRYVTTIVKKNVTKDMIQFMILQFKSYIEKISKRVLKSKLVGYFGKVTDPFGNEIGDVEFSVDEIPRSLYEGADTLEALKSCTKIFNFGHAKNGKSLDEVYDIREAEEIFYQQSQQLLRFCSFRVKELSTTPTADQMNNATNARPNIDIPSINAHPQKQDSKDNSLPLKTSELLELEIAVDAGAILPENMLAVLYTTIGLIDCNPRGMKRIVNLLQLIFVLGNIKPLDLQTSVISVAFSRKRKEWNVFLDKSVMWVVLCQNFPYRVSLLVQVLLDCEQKSKFNSSKSNSAFLYANHTGDEPTVDDDMPIFVFFLTKVDKYVKAFKNSDKLCRVDKDPEEFAFLLKETLTVGEHQSSITCGDILGPKKQKERISKSTTEAKSTHRAFVTSEEKLITISAHPHELKESDVDGRNFNCHICGRSGSGSLCQCTKSETCNFVCHKVCAKQFSPQSREEKSAGEVKRDELFSLLSYSFNLDTAMRSEVLLFENILHFIDHLFPCVTNLFRLEKRWRLSCPSTNCIHATVVIGHPYLCRRELCPASTTSLLPMMTTRRLYSIKEINLNCP